MSVNDVAERKERPAYVSFARVPVEDRAASAAEGHFVARDVDYVYVTPPYSKDRLPFKVVTWLEQMKMDVMNGRLPEDWAQKYRDQYNAWKNGQELPLSGFPIKGWGQISPAQQEMLVRMDVRTVEDLAAVNDEGMKRIGMAGLSLKSKAAAWLAQNQERGPITQKMAALEQENAGLKDQLENLGRQVQALQAAIPAREVPDAATEISVSDLLDDPVAQVAQYTAKFGKPPHHRMKPETIANALKE